jgi:cadmium resistance protein CadD (predicted permease)
MMFLSYKQGQKHYFIPYAGKKLAAYVLISIALYFIYYAVSYFITNNWLHILTGLILLSSFVLFIGRVERKEFSKLPFIGKFYTLPSPVATAPTQASDNMR